MKDELRPEPLVRLSIMLEARRGGSLQPRGVVRAFIDDCCCVFTEFSGDVWIVRQRFRGSWAV